MQRMAHGSASRRSIGTGLPHRSQVPYVPGPPDPAQVRSERLHHREQPGAFGRRVRAVGEPPFDVDRRVVRIRVAALFHDLLAQVLALLLERLAQLGELGRFDHAVSLLVARARGWDVK